MRPSPSSSSFSSSSLSFSSSSSSSFSSSSSSRLFIYISYCRLYHDISYRINNRYPGHNSHLLLLFDTFYGDKLRDPNPMGRYSLR